MADTRHQIVVKDRVGNAIGEFSDWLNLKFSDQLANYGYGQASFDIPIDSKDATKLLSLRRYEIDIIQDGYKAWSGEQANAEVEVSANGENLIKVTCYTYLEMWNARYTDQYIRYDATDQMSIIKDLIDISQAKTDGDWGFTFAPITPTKNRDREYKLDNIMESIVNMTNVIDGMDVWIDSNKVIHGGNLKKGTDKSNQFTFEMGINIQPLSISDNFSTPANTVYAIGSTDGESSLIGSFVDTSARATYGLREQVISTIEVSEIDTLNGKAEDLVNSNKNSKRTLKLTQIPETKPSLNNLTTGDYITVKFKRGRYNIGTPFRILGYECDVGKIGEPNITWVVSDFQGI